MDVSTLYDWHLDQVVRQKICKDGDIDSTLGLKAYTSESSKSQVVHVGLNG